MLTKTELTQWLLTKNYKPDKFGHYQKTLEINGQSKTYRYKIQDISTRYEVKIKYSDGHSDWLRLASGYYKDLSINDKQQICGLKR
jgi:hypothetical protein